MIKRTLAAIALIAASSFATWDKFPVLDQGNGQAKLGAQYNMQDKWTQPAIGVGARFSAVSNLEIALNLGYVLWTDYDGEDAEADGLTNPEIGIRYFLPMGLGFFLESQIPVGNEDVSYTGFSFHAGAQFSTKVSDIVAIGSELGVSFSTEDDDKYTEGMVLNVGAEGDFNLGMVTPFVGLDFYYVLTSDEWDGNEYGNDGDTGIAPYLGALFTFTPMVSADLKGTYGTGDYFGDDDVISIAVTGYVNF